MGFEYKRGKRKRRTLSSAPTAGMGLEPIRCCHQQILSLPRLPFRHYRLYLSVTKRVSTISQGTGFEPNLIVIFFLVQSLCFQLIPISA